LAAVLTIAGYSINDTVVIFDRVRESLRRYKKLPLPEVLNRAINMTLSRTILTSFTTLLALAALFFFGGTVIRGFTAGLIWGVVIGTYSSIGLAVPLLTFIKLRRGGADEEDTGAEAAEASS
jgi:preprotein translocase SecF subunit